MCCNTGYMYKLLLSLTFIGFFLCISAQGTVLKKTFSVPVGIYFSSKSFFFKKTGY
jgi:hypothetical protein